MPKAVTISASSAGALITPSMGTPTTTSGVRSTPEQFRLLQEASLTSLLLQPDSFFRHRELQRNRLLQDLSALQAALEVLVVAGADLRLPDPASPDTSKLASAVRRMSAAGNDPLGSEAVTAATKDLKSYLKQSGIVSGRDTSTSTSRTRSEARADLVGPLATARALLPKILKGVEEFLQAAYWYDPVALRRAVGPSIVSRGKEALESHRRRVDLGEGLSSRQDELLGLLTVPATMRALQAARRPLDPLVDASHPAGSDLEVRPLGPALPAEVQGTRQPSAITPGSTLVYTPSGASQRSISLLGKQHRLAAGPGEDYEVVEGVLLVEINGKLEDLFLTPGTRTQAQVLAELDTGMQLHGGQALRFLGGVTLLHPGQLKVADGGQVTRESFVIATGTFPMAIEGLTLQVDVTVLDPVLGPVTWPLLHLFGPSPHGVGNPYLVMQEIVDELAGTVLNGFPILGPPPFTLTASVVNGALVIRTNGVAGSPTTMAVNDPFSTAVPAPLVFSPAASSGWTDYTASDRTALGFSSFQGSTDYFSLETVAAVVTETEGGTPAAVASVETSPIWEGPGSFTTPTQYQPTAGLVGAQAGDILTVNGVGAYVVQSLAGTQLVVAPLHTRQAPLHLPTSATVMRSLLSLAVTDTEVSSQLTIGAGTANAQLGLVAGDYWGQSVLGEVFGRLKGERARIVRDLGALHVGVGASMELGGSSYLITGVSADRKSFSMPPASLDPSLPSPTLLSALATSFGAVCTTLRGLLLRPQWQWVRQAHEALQALEESSQGASSTGQLVDSLATLYSVSQQLGTPSSVALAALQRVGARSSSSPADTLQSVLVGWAPAISAETVALADATLSALEERGYDRLRDFLIRGVYHNAAAVDYEGASSASLAASKLSRAAEHFPTTRGVTGQSRMGDPYERR
mgnify:CR=1 FL=1